MSRKDGLPTNQEMLADFNALSHEVFVAAFERTAQEAWHPALDGKALSHVVYYHQKNYTAAANGTESTFEHERLSIQPLLLSDAISLTEHLTKKHLPEDVLKRYADIAYNLGQTSVARSLSVGDVLQPEGINADYTASFAGSSRSRHISTFKKKPSKQSIAAGKYFAQEALEFVSSPIFLMSRDDRMILRSLYADIGKPKSEILNGFRFLPVPDLHLNGFEGSKFITSYRDSMQQRVAMYTGSLQRLHNLGVPEAIINRYDSIIKQYRDASERAQQFLT